VPLFAGDSSSMAMASKGLARPGGQQQGQLNRVMGLAFVHNTAQW